MVKRAAPKGAKTTRNAGTKTGGTVETEKKKEAAAERSAVAEEGENGEASEEKPKRVAIGAAKRAAAKLGEKHAQFVEELLADLAGKLKQKDAKATLGDYIRLVQLQKELAEDEQPREIKVTWVEPAETQPAEAMNEESPQAETGKEPAAEEKSESGE